MAGLFDCVPVRRELPAFLGLLLCSACSTVSSTEVRDTSGSWSTDAYVQPADTASLRLHAARILDQPQEVVSGLLVRQVGAINTVIYEKPSVSSRALARLPFGTAVRVEVLTHFIRIPQGALMNECSPEEVVPSWVRVDAGRVRGWVSARSLTRPKLLARGVDPLTAADAVIAGANLKAADEILARSIKPTNFDFTEAAAFTLPPRMDVPVGGIALETLDAKLGEEVAAIRKTMTDPPAAWESEEPEHSLVGQVHALIKSSDEGIREESVRTIVEEMTPDLSSTPIEERFLCRESLAAFLGGRSAVVETDPVSAYVNWIGNRLVAGSTLPFPAYGIHFVVITDRSTSAALSLPGGVIVLTTGMLVSLQNEHELAAVLAREVAHMEERHSLAAVMATTGKKLNAALRIRGLLMTQALDPQLMKAFSTIESSMQAQIVQETHARLAEISDQTIEDSVRRALEAATQPSVADAAAADLRGLALLRAGGWSPAALSAVIARNSPSSASEERELEQAKRIEYAKAAEALLPPLPLPGKPGARWNKFAAFLQNGS